MSAMIASSPTILDLTRGRSAPARALRAAVLTLALGLGACAADAGPKQKAGTVVGAVAGGLAGSAFGKGTGKHIMIGLGTLLGSLAGSEVGRSLDRADSLYAARTAHETLETAPSGTTGTWVNPDNGHTGTVTPTGTFQRPDGTYCREFQQTVTIGGKVAEAYGTACRQPDGSWKIVGS